MRRRYLQFASFGVLVSACAACAGAAYAQAVPPPAPPTSGTPAASGSGLGEVVVTAERRAVNLQKAAVQVTAVTGKQLAQRDIVNFDQLTQAVPALQSQAGSGPYTTIIIRGITTTVVNVFGDPSSAVNLDGVYLARPTSLHGLFYDIDRIEVLKGPQGTLYGRNATGGAVNIVTNEPTYQFGGDISGEYGSYNEFLTTGDINAPVSQNLAARLAWQTIQHDGYFSDGTGNEDQQAVRLSMRADPTANLKMLFHADFDTEDDRGTGATQICAAGSPDPVNYEGKLCPATGAFYGPTPWTSVVTQSQFLTPPGLAPLPNTSFNKGDHWGVSNETDWKVLGGTVTFIPEYRGDDVNYLTEIAGGGIREVEHSWQTSFELRYASAADQPVRYVVGAYYFDGATHADAVYDAQANGVDSVQNVGVSDMTYAFFGQATWAVTDRFRLTGGLRYTYDQKGTDSRAAIYSYFVPEPYPLISPHSFEFTSFETVGSRSWDATNWKAGFEYDVAPQSMLYFNVSTGFQIRRVLSESRPGRPEFLQSRACDRLYRRDQEPLPRQPPPVEPGRLLHGLLGSADRDPVVLTPRHSLLPEPERGQVDDRRRRSRSPIPADAEHPVGRRRAVPRCALQQPHLSIRRAGARGLSLRLQSSDGVVQCELQRQAGTVFARMDDEPFGPADFPASQRRRVHRAGSRHTI